MSKVLEARLNGGNLVIQPKAAVVAAFNEKIQNELKTTSFAADRCGS